MRISPGAAFGPAGPPAQDDPWESTRLRTTSADAEDVIDGGVRVTADACDWTATVSQAPQATDVFLVATVVATPFV